jgi:hypothetical protein
VTTYYISPSGSDANNGLGPDASHATNKPWLTFSKAMTGATPVVPGDTVYVGPGFYYSAGCTVITAITSSASPTTFEGDPDNRLGFKDGSGVRLTPGVCWATTRSAADTLGGPITLTTDLFNLNTNGPDGLIFRKLCLEAQVNNGSIFPVSLATVTGLTVEDCRLIGQAVIFGNTGAPTAGRGYRVRRCLILGGSLLTISNANAAATADADLDIVYEDNLCLGARMGSLAIGASGGNLGGGVIYRRNTIFACAAQSLVTTALRVSTVVPIRLTGNIHVASTTVGAGTAGHVVSDGYGVDVGIFTPSNYTPHATDVLQPAMLLNLPDLVKWGLAPPMYDVCGWSPDASASQRATGATVTLSDFRGRTPRPWGAGGPSVGAWEAASMSKDTSSAITGGGTNAVALTGAGETPSPILVPVRSGVAITLTIKTKSTTYGGTNWPQAILEPRGSIGFAGLTATATSAAEQTLTLGPFTPTADGVVELRLVSRSTTPSSTTLFDVLVKS